MSRTMKDSGIPWIGEIPSHWRKELIGSCIKEVNNPNENNVEDNALQFKMGTIISKKCGDSKYHPETLEAYNIVQQGDIVLNGLNLSFDFISQRVGIVQEKGVITSAYLAVRPLNILNSEYLNYLFKAYDCCKALHSMGKGLRQTLGYKEFRRYYVIFPELKEQQAIADFLDKKCSEIDELISLQEKIIEELKAYKQSVITEAVTKGLNPNVPMKDSGIEWIGKIPEGWGVGVGKSIYLNNDGGVWGEEPFGKDDTMVLRSTEQDIDGHLIIENPAFRHLSSKEVASALLMEGDLIITKSSGSPSHIGKTSIIDKQTASLNCCFSNFIQRIRVSGCPVYYWYAFNSYSTKKQFDYLSTTTTGINNINAKIIDNVIFAVPPFSEQQAIADYLDKKCSEIDSLIALKQDKIEYLKEYKKSIIYEYTTGKKEVQYGE